MSKAATKAEREHLGRIKELGCIACMIDGKGWGVPADAHHITDCGRRLGHFITIPLCEWHHREGKVSVGKAPQQFERIYGNQLRLLNQTIRELYG